MSKWTSWLPTFLISATHTTPVFERMIESMQAAAQRFDPFFPRAPFASKLTWAWPPYLSWPPTPQAIASLVPASEQLVLAAVELSSPGAWEFLGSLNPLEVIRKSVNDAHERRKDREYRESAERRRLDLENIQAENEALAGRIRIAKELGATDADLAPLLNELVRKPLADLRIRQDQGVIEDAELEVLPHHPSGRRR
jgi:hypothetical protein